MQLFDDTTFIIQGRYRKTNVHFTFYTIDKRKKENELDSGIDLRYLYNKAV
jgi:hypothetical protein